MFEIWSFSGVWSLVFGVSFCGRSKARIRRVYADGISYWRKMRYFAFDQPA